MKVLDAGAHNRDWVIEVFFHEIGIRFKTASSHSQALICRVRLGSTDKKLIDGLKKMSGDDLLEFVRCFLEYRLPNGERYRQIREGFLEAFFSCPWNDGAMMAALVSVAVVDRHMDGHIDHVNIHISPTSFHPRID